MTISLSECASFVPYPRGAIISAHATLLSSLIPRQETVCIQYHFNPDISQLNKTGIHCGKDLCNTVKIKNGLPESMNMREIKLLSFSTNLISCLRVTLSFHAGPWFHTEPATYFKIVHFTMKGRFDVFVTLFILPNIFIRFHLILYSGVKRFEWCQISYRFALNWARSGPSCIRLDSVISPFRFESHLHLQMPPTSRLETILIRILFFCYYKHCFILVHIWL